MEIAVQHPHLTLEKQALIAKIKVEVTKEFGVELTSLDDFDRREPLPMIRHTAMALAHELTALSYPEVAFAFNRDAHGTIIHAVKANRARYDSDKKFRARYEKIRSAVLSNRKGKS